MTLLAGAMTQGCWAAVVGQPDFGALAAGTDFSIPLQRLAAIPNPGPDRPTVVSTLIDGLGLVAVTTTGAVPNSTSGALINRARQRGCVLLPNHDDHRSQGEGTLRRLAIWSVAPPARSVHRG